MQCLRPLKAGFNSAGAIVFSNKLADKSQVGIQFECRKCLPCRLNIAREKAIRVTHEAKMHKDNIFLTLTYDEEHLKSPKLQYLDFQLFMKSLREKITRNVHDKEMRDKLYIPYMVTGEYGEENKRPHWHAIIFNYRPTDQAHLYTSHHGEEVFTSDEIHKLWKRGKHEFGSVTIDSAGYVARYAAKKLVHGQDQDHDYHPIHKTSSRRGIGRSWIEKYYKHTFENGFVVLPNGQQAKIPRYYVDWLKKNQPELYTEYVTGVREEIIEKSIEKNRKEEMEYLSEMFSYKGGAYPQSRAKVKETILKQRFKRLQENLKL
jgi:hypothetical protein